MDFPLAAGFFSGLTAAEPFFPAFSDTGFFTGFAGVSLTVVLDFKGAFVFTGADVFFFVTIFFLVGAACFTVFLGEAATGFLAVFFAAGFGVVFLTVFGAAFFTAFFAALLAGDFLLTVFLTGFFAAGFGADFLATGFLAGGLALTFALGLAGTAALALTAGFFFAWPLPLFLEAAAGLEDFFLLDTIKIPMRLSSENGMTTSLHR